MKDLEKTVTENLRKIIQSRNLTQSTLATYAGISESQFSRVMNGQVKLSLNQLAKIASNLEVEVIDIITYPQVYVPKEQNQEDSEVILQLKHCESHNRHFLLACYILHYMFVRPHEMSLIKIGDFNLTKKTLILHGEQTKNRQDAVITLPDHIVKLMVELGTFNNPSQYYLFSDGCRPGKTWRDSKQFRDYWNRHIRKDLGLPAEYKFYSLKDTGITNMLRANTDPISVRDQARHSSLLITNSYTPLDIKEANPLILQYRGVL